VLRVVGWEGTSFIAKPGGVVEEWRREQVDKKIGGKKHNNHGRTGEAKESSHGVGTQAAGIGGRDNHIPKTNRPREASSTGQIPTLPEKKMQGNRNKVKKVKRVWGGSRSGSCTVANMADREIIIQKKGGNRPKGVK